MIDNKVVWFGLGFAAGVGVCFVNVTPNVIEDRKEKREEDQRQHPSNETRVQYNPGPWNPGVHYNSRSQDKNKPRVTISIDPRRKTDQPLVKLEWEKKNK